MRRRRGGRNYRSKILTAFILLLLCLAVHLIDSQIRPVITEFAGYKIKSIAVESINKAVMDEFVDNGYTYDDLSVINRDENNAVSSIVMNSVLLNRIKAELVQMVQDNIKKNHNTTLEIPIGTLSCIHLLS